MATESSPLKAAAAARVSARQYALLSLIVTMMLVDSTYINEVCEARAHHSGSPPSPHLRVAAPMHAHAR